MADSEGRLSRAQLETLLNTIHDLDDVNFEALLILLSRTSRDEMWPIILHLVLTRPNLLMKKFFFDYVATGLNHELTVHQEKVLEVLLKRRLELDCVEPGTSEMDHYVSSVYYYNHPGLFSLFTARHLTVLSHSLNRINRTYVEDQITLLRHTTELLTRAEHQARWQVPQYRSMLATCIRRGLCPREIAVTSQADIEKLRSVTVFAIAVKRGWLDLMRLFYKTGLVSNAELTIQHHRLEVRIRGDHESGNISVRHQLAWVYAMRAATNPKRLRDLCVVSVSHLIGCHDDREDRVRGLPIPEGLKGEVLFEDVLQEFLTGVCSDHCREKDPPDLTTPLVKKD